MEKGFFFCDRIENAMLQREKDLREKKRSFEKRLRI